MFNTAATIAKLKNIGIPPSKLLLGLGFYGRGWTGVTQSEPGGSATGPAPATWEAGNEEYKVLKTKYPPTGTVGGTAYAKCGDEWWNYDTPSDRQGEDEVQEGAEFGWHLLLGTQR